MAIKNKLALWFRVGLFLFHFFPLLGPVLNACMESNVVREAYRLHSTRLRNGLRAHFQAPPVRSSPPNRYKKIEAATQLIHPSSVEGSTPCTHGNILVAHDACYRRLTPPSSRRVRLRRSCFFLGVLIEVLQYDILDNNSPVVFVIDCPSETVISFSRRFLFIVFRLRGIISEWRFRQRFRILTREI